MHITTTRRRVLLFASSFLALFTRGAGSHNTGAEQETAAVLNKHMNWMGDAFVPAAEAMPEDKFFWAPTHGEFRGVRSFAEQLLHVAEVNFLLSAAIRAEKPPATASFAEHKPETMQTRFRESRALVGPVRSA